MRKFTPEEKELIVNTFICIDCFDMSNFSKIKIGESGILPSKVYWAYLCLDLEKLRQKYNETKDERFFIELVRLLPNSYKVVKL